MEKNRNDSVKVSFIDSPSNRRFIVKFLNFENGCFVSISESDNLIGSISVSINTKDLTTATVIPSKYDSMFINSLSKRVSYMINGISIISLHTKEQLKLEDMKTIMGEILNLISDAK